MRLLTVLSFLALTSASVCSAESPSILRSRAQARERGTNYSGSQQFANSYDYVARTGGIGVFLDAGSRPSAWSQLKAGQVLNLKNFKYSDSFRYYFGSTHWVRVESVNTDGTITISASNLNGFKGRVDHKLDPRTFSGTAVVYSGTTEVTPAAPKSAPAAENIPVAPQAAQAEVTERSILVPAPVTEEVDFSEILEDVIEAFETDPDVEKVLKAGTAPEMGETQAALVDFSSCRIAVNGCFKEFFVSKALQDGASSGPRLISATVVHQTDGEGKETIKVKGITVKK